MIRGYDISHHNPINDWSKIKPDFIIQKATEGTTFKDPTYEVNKAQCRNRSILFGSYHFMSSADPIKQADFFLKTVGNMETGELLVLDYEIQNSNPDQFCSLFLARCFEKTGVKPLIYMNSSTASGNWTNVLRMDTGLWIANYKNNDGTIHQNPPIGKWPFFVLHQYTSAGLVNGISGRVDLNYGNISPDTLRKYGKQGVVCSHKCPAHCPVFIP